MKKIKKAAIVALIGIIILRLENLAYGCSLLAQLVSLPPQLIPGFYSKEMGEFALTIAAMLLLLMVIFPKKEKYMDRRDKEMAKINRGAYSQRQWPFL